MGYLPVPSAVALEVIVGIQMVPLYLPKPSVVFDPTPWPMGGVKGVGSVYPVNDAPFSCHDVTSD